jgi:Na+/proline symporter
MTPQLILYVFVVYTVLLFAISWFTVKKSTNESFFIGNRQSPWYVVAYGMIGASLSGVTFISIPGWVGDSHFSYMMVVFGYLFGYTFIALVLMPLYYRLNLTSIYSYLEQRFGFYTYKTGAAFFLLSRIIGASFRMFLVINVLQIFVFDSYNVPFFISALLFIVLILLYTFRGGIKTIIWTDTIQTTFMLASLIITIYVVAKALGLDVSSLINSVRESDYSKLMVYDWGSKNHFLKQLLSGASIAVVMTGLDQEMMQKNLSCRNIKDAQKNMFSFSFILIFVNLLFLFLGAVLYIYVDTNGITMPRTTDELFPLIALKYFKPIVGLVFVIGLMAAAYSSADGALTALTTSFFIDFLNINKRNDLSESRKKSIRQIVHISFAFVLFLMINLFKTINNEAVIKELFTIAGYTYGPLLGMFMLGLFTRINVQDKYVPLVAVASPIICYITSIVVPKYFNYNFGFELLILNGLITYLGMLMLSTPISLKKRL